MKRFFHISRTLVHLHILFPVHLIDLQTKKKDPADHLLPVSHPRPHLNKLHQKQTGEVERILERKANLLLPRRPTSSQVKMEEHIVLNTLTEL